MTALGGLAVWLVDHVEWLRHHPAGSEAYDEITSVVAAVERLVDRPPTGRRIPCPSAVRCEGHVWVTLTSTTAGCDTCDWETEDLRWLGNLLRAGEPIIVDAYAAVHRLASDGHDLTPATIRKWAERGKVEVRNVRGPACWWCEHGSCGVVRGQKRHVYDYEQLLRTAQRVALT